jgi:excisionase family DNA binding protein
MTNTSTYLTRKEVAALLRVSLVTIDTYSKRGYLQPLGIGGRILFRASDVDNALIEL